MPDLSLQAAIFLLVLALTGAIRAFAVRREILDIPQARSAHTTPTPVGGGLAIVLVLLGYCIYLLTIGDIASQSFLVLSGAFFIAILGLFDDVLRLNVWVRLTLQFLSAIWSLVWLGEVAAIDIAGWQLTQQWLLIPLAAFALVWLLNLYNFMDGIDGFAGSELLFVNVMTLLFVINNNAPVVMHISAALAASAAGFLVWNWPPAKIFMGDVGSGFSGFMLGILALLSMQAGVMTVFTWLILLGVFVTDATITLVRRAVNNERWYEGHSTHAYQHAARHYKSHGKVTITMIVVNCVWLAPLAYMSTQQQELGIFYSFIALLPLAVASLRMEAGKPPLNIQLQKQ